MYTYILRALEIVRTNGLTIKYITFLHVVSQRVLVLFLSFAVLSIVNKFQRINEHLKHDLLYVREYI